MNVMYLWLLLSVFCAAVAQLMLRVGASGSNDVMDFFNHYIFFGLALYAVSTVVWIYALSKVSLVQVYAFTALTFVLVYVGAVVFLGETLTVVNMVGIFLVLLGLGLIVLV